MRKIGELKGKPIVEGNPNEIKNNQIHAKTEGGGITLSERKNGSLETISGSSSGGGSSKYAPKYYRFKEDAPNESTQMAMYGSSVKIYRNGDISIGPLIDIVAGGNIKILEFGFNPVHIEIAGTKMYVDSFEEFLDNGGVSEIKQYIERITEEEYYKID